MLDELLKEIAELRKYKKEYEKAKYNAQVVSDRLFKLMMKDYEKMLYYEKVKEHQEQHCKYCVYNNRCSYDLPDDIWKPIPSDDAWGPGRVLCKNFQRYKQEVGI